MKASPINVYSEIGTLRKVLLHRPGEEIENLTPNYLDSLLFDDIPFLKVARQEHDYFAKVLRDNGVEVIYVENLAAEAIQEPQVKEKFVNEILKDGGLRRIEIIHKVKDYLLNMENNLMIEKIISGVREKDVGFVEDRGEFPFITYPMPNLYFTRDPFASIGRGVSINTMKTHTRQRETIFAKYIFQHHPDFKDRNIPKWYSRDEEFSIEGGDELVLSEDVLAVGHSQRTDSEAVLKMARNIFKGGESFKKILIISIPKTRAFMHLDTVMTMVDHDKFTVHPGIESVLKVTVVQYNEKTQDLMIEEEEETLEKMLSKYLNKDITLIRCGGGDKIIASREQWNDGANTLAIKPGTVITYERNYVTNEILDKYKINVIPIPSAELSRGRGGPRCMSMPLYRENI